MNRLCNTFNAAGDWDNGVSQEVYPAFNEEVNVTAEEEVATVMNFDTAKFRIYLTGFHACWCTHTDMEKRNLLIMQHARKEMFYSQCVYPYECHYWWNQKETNSMKNYSCIRQKLISSWNNTYIGWKFEHCLIFWIILLLFSAVGKVCSWRVTGSSYLNDE